MILLRLLCRSAYNICTTPKYKETSPSKCSLPSSHVSTISLCMNHTQFKRSSIFMIWPDSNILSSSLLSKGFPPSF